MKTWPSFCHFLLFVTMLPEQQRALVDVSTFFKTCYFVLSEPSSLCVFITTSTFFDKVLVNIQKICSMLPVCLRGAINTCVEPFRHCSPARFADLSPAWPSLVSHSEQVRERETAHGSRVGGPYLQISAKWDRRFCLHSLQLHWHF